MKAEVAKAAGFCFGVKRSLDLAQKAVDGKKKVYLLKEPIHNPVAIKMLLDKGAKLVKEIDDVPDGSTVVIRAHGEVPCTYEKAVEKGLEIIDCTCPFVAMVQKKAKQLEEEEYQVVIVGEKDHAEVLGIKGNTKKGIVIQDMEEAEELFRGREQYMSNAELSGEKTESGIVEKLYASIVNKVGVVAQTTQTDQNFSEIVSVLAKRARETRAFNTICSATHVRQPAAVELAKKSGVMIVIGGKNSGNTKRLYELCGKHCAETHWIETAEELDKKWFEGKKKAGITAGASTPQQSIDEAKKWVESL